MFSICDGRIDDRNPKYAMIGVIKLNNSNAAKAANGLFNIINSDSEVMNKDSIVVKRGIPMSKLEGGDGTWFA
jgi:hypothetical protein